MARKESVKAPAREWAPTPDFSMDYLVALRPQFLGWSKEQLLRGWQSATSGCAILGGLWYEACAKRFGVTVTNELSREVWVSPFKPVELNKVVEVKLEPVTNYRMAVEEIRMIREWMKIKGDDVETLAKMLPCMGGTVGHLDYEIDLKNKNHGIFTIKRCTVLEAMESMDESIGGLNPRHLCWEIEAPGFAMAAHYVNPKIKTIPRKLPPRKSKDEIACQWEYILEA